MPIARLFKIAQFWNKSGIRLGDPSLREQGVKSLEPNWNWTHNCSGTKHGS